MAFAFSDHHIDEYRTQGYTVFRQILPPSLVADLRRVCDEARDLARQQRGPQAQRLQPIADFPLDQQPFADYVALPVLNDALHRLLSPAFPRRRPAGHGRALRAGRVAVVYPLAPRLARQYARLGAGALGRKLCRRPLLQPSQLRPVRRLVHVGRPPAATCAATCRAK